MRKSTASEFFEMWSEVWAQHNNRVLSSGLIKLKSRGQSGCDFISASGHPSL